MQKLNWISGLRGLIALTIVLYHLQQIRPISNLASWDWALYQFFNMLPVVVGVFFILTGLLRSLAYWEHILHNQQKPQTRKVLWDRLWRITPAYYIVLILSFWWGIYLSDFTVTSLFSLFSGFTFLNWISPDTFFPTTINGPLWFIGYDMMGYIFTIILMIWLSLVHKKYIYLTITAYIIWFLVLHYIWISLPWPPQEGIVGIWFPYYSPFIFALYSIMGIIIGGIVSAYRNFPKNIVWDIIFLMSIFSIMVYIWLIRGAPDLAYSYPTSPYRFPLIPGVWALSIFSLIYSKYMGILMDNRFFIWLSSISYSLYLWHWLIMSIFLSLIFLDVSISFIEWIEFSIATLIASLWVAVLSVKYIEKWVMKKLKQ